MSDGDDIFQWILHNENTLETEIIFLFKQLTGTRAKLVFKPAGWFVKKLEKDVIEAITPLRNPFAKVKEMTPPRMYALAMLYTPRDHSKVVECRALCLGAHCFPRADRGQLFGAAFCHLQVLMMTGGFSYPI